MNSTLPSQPPLTVAVAASFTAEPLQPFLEFWAGRLSSPFDVRFAPFNQLLQTLLDPASLFYSNHSGANVIVLRFEDLAQLAQDDPAYPQTLEANASQLTSAMSESILRFSAPLLAILCPPSAEFEHAALEDAFSAALAGIPSLHFIHYRDMLALYPVAGPLDPHAARIARVPYTEEMFAALATAIVRRVHTLFIPPYKAIAVDLDNTLWRGICGEDGPGGVVLDPPRRALHEFLLVQRESGMLLAIASKNNAQDAADTFAAHPEFPLSLAHFAASRIDWNPKPANLASLAAELNLGLDSFIFIDDNPKECAEVSSAAPAVLSIPLPAQLEDMPAFLSHIWAFDHPRVTKEDRRRAGLIGQSLEFSRAARSATSLDEFIATLNLRVDVEPLAAERLPRAAQLTQRTNQFNTSGIRRSEAELLSLLNIPACHILTAEVSDRFGEYGLTGLVILFSRINELYVDSLLLSCRVLGRGVEHRILSALAEFALDEGVYTVTVPFHPSPRNAPARAFLDSIHSGEVIEDNGDLVYRFPATELQALRWSPYACTGAAPVPAQAAFPSTRRFNDYAAIATDLRSPAQIVAALRRESAARHAAACPALSTETEQKLAAIWSELLKTPVSSPDANFFDLGGHSLLAVLLLMRIKEEFGVELPVDEVYSGSLTLSALSTVIEAHRLGAADPDEYQALLAEIENLSDEEVRALLDKESREE